MTNLKTEFMVGSFTLVVIGILTLMTFKVADFSFSTKDGTIVYTYFHNTAGLEEKTKIKIAGVDAGVVENIQLIRGTAKLTIRLYPGVVLYDDAVASIKATGLLGDKFVEIKIGAAEPILVNGDTIRNSKEMADIDELVSKLTDISVDLGGFVSELNNDEFKESLRNTMANLEDITTRIKADTPEIMDDLKAAIAELRKVMDNAGPRVESIAKKVDDAMDNIQSIARKIDDGQGTIGKLVNDEELYTSVNNAAKGIEKTLGGIDRFRTFINFKTEHIPSEHVTKGYFDVTLQPREDRFYVLGLVTSPIGAVDTTITITNTTIYKEEDKVEDNIQFVAQFGNRWNDTSLRIGLTENTFGVGADQYMMKDRIKFAFDAWDFNADEYEAERPHLKVGANLYATRNLYFTAGYDNPLNSNREGVFIGAGVRFEDKDFKYLFGSAASALPTN